MSAISQRVKRKDRSQTGTLLSTEDLHFGIRPILRLNIHG